MNAADVERLAREAGLPIAWISETGVLKWSELARFAALVEAAAIANIDLTQLTTRGAVAWAGVEPQALREGN